MACVCLFLFLFLVSCSGYFPPVSGLQCKTVILSGGFKQAGHNEIVALLLEGGADVNPINYCGQTTLIQACRYGH